MNLISYTCFKLLNGPTHGAAVKKVLISMVMQNTSSRKVDDAIADVDTCPDELNSGGASHDATTTVLIMTMNTAIPILRPCFWSKYSWSIW